MTRTFSFPSLPNIRLKRGGLLALALFMALGAGSAAAADAMPTDLARIVDQERLDMRGVFVDAFGTQYRDQLSTQRLARQLKEYNVQTAFVQVVVLGEGYYNSEILPRPAGMPVGYVDPLGDLLDSLEQTRNGEVLVHAWINPLQAMNERTVVPPQAGHAAVEHPEWLTQDIEGNRADADGWIYFDPGHPQVQDYVVEIVKELAENYAIKGILIDGLHYPEQGTRFGYNETALERYREETGAQGVPDPLDPAWLDWRRAQLTALLARVTREVKQAKPSMIISANVLGTGPAPRTTDGFKFSDPYMARLQNWLRWAEYDLADWFVLQNFVDEQTEASRFNAWTEFAVEHKAGSVLWVAIAGYRNWAIDAFQQIQRGREIGVDAVAVNNFRQPVKDISTAPDFFSALQTVTAVSATQSSEQPGDLDERLRRMAEALERPQMVAMPESEPIPGVDVTPPVPDTRGALGGGVPALPSHGLPFLDPWDRVYLTNRTMFEGHKIGEMNGESMFETSSGVIIKINNQYIDRIRPGE